MFLWSAGGEASIAWTREAREGGMQQMDTHHRGSAGQQIRGSAAWLLLKETGFMLFSLLCLLFLYNFKIYFIISIYLIIVIYTVNIAYSIQNTSTWKHSRQLVIIARKQKVYTVSGENLSLKQKKLCWWLLIHCRKKKGICWTYVHHETTAGLSWI